MIRNVDLFNLANSGVSASNQLLQTTSKNIANINTEGYVRERTTFEGGILGSVGEGTTERVISVFAQNQLRRDITKVGELEIFEEKTSTIDNLLATEANSISAGMSDFFASLQTAADDPTNLASREVVLGEGREMLRRFQSISDYMLNKEEEVNLEFDALVDRANELITNIGELNRNILVAQGNFSAGAEPTTLMNQRDKAINELAELVSIETRETHNGTGAITVSLTSGESLVLEDGQFNLFDLTTKPDLDYKELNLSTNFTGAKQNTSININEDDLGGKIGGLFRFRDEVLSPAQRDIGQLALAFADAVNSQNKLGMDLDQELGSNLFTLPEFEVLNYPGTPDTLVPTSQLTEGKGTELTDSDYKVTVTAAAAGVPTQVTVELLNADGSAKKDSGGNPVTYTGITVTGGFAELPGGIEIDFSGSTGYAVDNEFLIQPTRRTASDIELATERPEDLAFALPIRVEADAGNLGNATISAVQVTNTNVGGPDESAFDGTGDIQDETESPAAPLLGAPAQVNFTSPTDFEVRDSSGNLITTVSGVSDYQNLLAQAEASGAAPPWPASFSALSDYPGYDFSIEGVPKAGDSFTLQFNTGGVNDNANALELVELQQEKLVQLSNTSSGLSRSFQDAYSSLVGKVGEKSSSADISLQAAEAMKDQSTAWFESVSGVNLDEEAANLIRFQQSYAAAARILSTAQELFDTILSAAR